MLGEEEVFLQQILEDRDRLFRENSKLKGQIASLEDFDAEKASLLAQIKDKDQRIEKLLQQVDVLLRKIWGKSSERYIQPDPLQRRIDFDGLDILPEEIEQAEAAKEEIVQYTSKSEKAKPKKKPVRKPLPEDLPREEFHIYPKNIDTENWVELQPEITEVLEKDPARYYVRKIIRHKYALKSPVSTEQPSIITAPMPALPIAKSYAGASILADITIDKYVNHLPFYRQIQMFKQQGISIPASTLNDWNKEVADLMRPVYYRLNELILASDYIQSDETTIPVINNEKHKTVKGYIWMLRAVMPKLVLFHYDSGSRAQKVALQLFKDFQGVIQTDGYAVYDMYENKKGVLPIGCWAHARRKFEEALKEDQARASYALEQIGLLYQVERQRNNFV